MHVLSTPPAFILSQDQTLRCRSCPLGLLQAPNLLPSGFYALRLQLGFPSIASTDLLPSTSAGAFASINVSGPLPLTQKVESATKKSALSGFPLRRLSRSQIRSRVLLLFPSPPQVVRTQAGRSTSSPHSFFLTGPHTPTAGIRCNLNSFLPLPKILDIKINKPWLQRSRSVSS